MDFPYTLDSQDDLNRIIGERIAREREKYSDYESLKSENEALKASAAELGKLKESHESEVAKLQATAEEAIKWRTEREASDQLNALKADIAKSHSIPSSALRGSTKEELESHAEELKSLITAQPVGPVIPSQGKEPSGKLDGGDVDKFFTRLRGVRET